MRMTHQNARLLCGCRLGGLILSGFLAALMACGGSSSTTSPDDTKGALEVSVTTSGTKPDLDGYTLSVDDAPSQAISNSATLTFENIEVGEHRVAIGGLASNCNAAGGAARTAAVSAGKTTAVTIAVSCPMPEGSVQLSTTTDGLALDSDGYTVRLDNGPVYNVGVTAALTLSAVAEGEHTVQLGGLASNCSVAGMNTRSVTVTPNQVVQVAFAVTCVFPLPGRLVFLDKRNGNPGFYTVKSDGSEVTRLPLDAVFDYVGAESIASSFPSPLAWSPDGMRLAFRSDGANPDIYTIQTDGANLTRLTTAAGTDREPQWSPDGSKILFVSTRCLSGGTIYVMNADGTSQHQLTSVFCNSNTSTWADAAPSWSPDGASIVFASNRDEGYGNWDIYRMNADGSGVIRLIPEDGTAHKNRYPLYSPDGSKLLYSAISGFWLQLTSGFRDELTAPGGAGTARWAPDGSKVVFASGVSNSPPREVMVVNADGTGRRVLANRPNPDDFSPIWSTDGNWIAFTSDENGSRTVYVVRPNGTSLTRLTSGTAVGWLP